MPLVSNTPNEETPAQRLAKEARARLAEFTNSTFIVYGNLMNYRHNNGAGVTPEQFDKAFGSDIKDFTHIRRAMRRMLLRLNPALRPQLNEMVPKRVKKAAK
jgi:hypothetical protein